MKKTLAMLMILALLCAAALAEDAAFELGHMEDTTYVNDDLGIAFSATGFSGMEQSYAGEALDEANGCAWNDAAALLGKLDAGEALTCYAFGDASMHIAGAVNMIRINVYSAAEGAEDPAVALLEEGRASFEQQAKDNGFTLEKAEIGEMEFIGAMRPCLSLDAESGGRHKQVLYVAVSVGERVYRIDFDMDASEVDGYLSHFSAR